MFRGINVCQCAADAGLFRLRTGVVRTGDDHAEMAVGRGFEGDRDCAGTGYGSRDVAARCRDGGKGAECFSGGSGAVIVGPGLCKHAGFAGGRCLRRPWRPKAELGSLVRVRVGSAYIDDEGIGRYLNVGGEAHSTAVLYQRSVVQIKTAAEIGGRGERGKTGDDKLARRVPMREGVFSVQLRSESICRPDSDAETSVAHRHRFLGQRVGVAQHNFRPAYQASGIHSEVAGFPRSRGKTLLGDGGEAADSTEGNDPFEKRHPSGVSLRFPDGQSAFSKNYDPAEELTPFTGGKRYPGFSSQR